MSPPYAMRLNLNILEHLGLNLYSNIPAVLAEAVANAWDADARHVHITLDIPSQTINIQDDGIGMDARDLNDKFLLVGFRRRDTGLTTTKLGRHVMGRKGIGKLALFAIADHIEVRSAVRRKGRPIERSGFTMTTDDIRSQIGKGGTEYHPTPLDPTTIVLDRGTDLTLKRLRLRLNANSESALRKRLARRFSVIGAASKFQVYVNHKQVGVQDRDYFAKVEYLWSVGDVGDKFERLTTNAKKMVRLPGIVDASRGYKVTGWVATLDEQRGIDDENNALTVLAWGKLVQEDLLSDIRAGGLYTKYLMG